KALIGMFGGLSAAGYFEMARQLVSKVRHLLIAANQVIVPVVAGFKRQEQLTAMYRANVQLLLTAAIPLYGLLSAWAPLVSELWIGNFEPQFVQFVIALCLGLGVNTLSGPAYFSMRSEERRVGKECRSRWWRGNEEKENAETRA